MGWSESYFKDFEEQARIDLGRKASRLMEEAEEFLHCIRDGEGALLVDANRYEKALEGLIDWLKEDFQLNR